MITGDATRYTLLLSSLPYLPPPLSQQRFIPPTRIQIGKALALLSEEDAQRMQRIHAVIHWSHLPLARDDATMIDQVNKLMAGEKSLFLRELMLDRLELRTLIAALRRRELDRKPQPGEPWVISRYTGHILANWHDPAFGLGHLFGWLNEAARLLHQGDSLALDRLLMRESWRRLQRVDDRHDFGFDAVVLYMMRWNILDRFSRQHEGIAVSRFESMVNDALADHKLVFESAGA